MSNSSVIGGQSQTTAAGVESKLQRRLIELLSDRVASLPVWVRAPKGGHEHYTGLTRSKLYELDGAGHIRSVSLREPGQIKGVRLFELQSILSYIARCAVTPAAKAGEQAEAA